MSRHHLHVSSASSPGVSRFGIRPPRVPAAGWVAQGPCAAHRSRGNREGGANTSGNNLANTAFVLGVGATLVSLALPQFGWLIFGLPLGLAAVGFGVGGIKRAREEAVNASLSQAPSSDSWDPSQRYSSGF